MQKGRSLGDGRVLRADSRAFAILTLDHPHGHSTLDQAMIGEIVGHLDDVESDDSVRAIILTGTGRFFCTGAALAKTGFKGPAADGDDHGASRDGGGVLALRLYEFAKPVIVALNGDAVGVGASMILPCDIRLSVPTARIGFVQARRGIALEGCASWFLPRVVGISHAVEWSVSGRLVCMEEAMQAGLIHDLHPAEQLLSAAIRAAEQLTAESAPVSASVTRKMLWNALSLPSPMSAHQVESHIVRTLMDQADAREGVSAFFERRTPVFRDKPSSALPEFSKWWEDQSYDEPTTATS